LSAPMGKCSVCGQRRRLTPKGLIYTHTLFGECEGSRKPPAFLDVNGGTIVNIAPPNPDHEVYTVGFVNESVRTKTGYTDEDMHEMLKNLTPKRQRLRERISTWLRKLRGSH